MGPIGVLANDHWLLEVFSQKWKELFFLDTSLIEKSDIPTSASQSIYEYEMLSMFPIRAFGQDRGR
jgi:hypothetical protein